MSGLLTEKQKNHFKIMISFEKMLIHFEIYFDISKKMVIKIIGYQRLKNKIRK